MHKNKIMSNIVLNLIVTVITGLGSFAISKYFAENMGIDYLGLMKLFSQLISYLSLVEMGLGTASTYALYKPLLNKNYKEINIVISTIDSIYKRISLFILILGIIMSPFLHYIIKQQDQIIKNIEIYWILYVVSISLSYIFSKYNILFLADQKYNIVRIIQGICKICSQLFQIIVIIKYKNFYYFIIILIIENIFQYIFYKIYFKKNYQYVTKVKERKKTIIKDITNLFWHKLAGLIVFNTDYIIISKFISLKVVGIYSNYLLISSTIGMLMGIIINVLNPVIGKYIAVNTKEKIFELWKLMDIVNVYIGIIFSLTTLKLANIFIKLLFGKEFVLPNLTLYLIIINLFIQITRNLMEVFKNNSGFFSDIHLPFLEAIINLISSLILVNYMGLNGVILGTILSNIIIICLAKPMLVFEECFLKRKTDYIKLFLNKFILIMMVLIFTNYIFKYLILMDNINTWLEFIYLAIKTSLIIFIVSSIIFYFNSDFKCSITRIIKFKRS